MQKKNDPDDFVVITDRAGMVGLMSVFQNQTPSLQGPYGTGATDSVWARRHFTCWGTAML